MISEREVATGFQDLWNNVVPLLTPHFVHLFNEAYRKDLVDEFGVAARPVPAGPGTDATVVAEYAFNAAQLAHQRGVPISTIGHEHELLQHAEEIALNAISEYDKARERPRGLTDAERGQSMLLLHNYELFLNRYPQNEVEFRVQIPGSGYVDTCKADLSVEDTLFEVKTVNRNIAGKDIRQLLIYIALQAATGRQRWSHGGFFNPRRGDVYHFALDKLVPLMSGGRLTSEVFEQMVIYFSMRDIHLDSGF